MAAREFSPQDLQKVHDLAHQWGKIVVRHAFGDDGPARLALDGDPAGGHCRRH